MKYFSVTYSVFMLVFVAGMSGCCGPCGVPCFLIRHSEYDSRPPIAVERPCTVRKIFSAPATLDQVAGWCGPPDQKRDGPPTEWDYAALQGGVTLVAATDGRIVAGFPFGVEHRPDARGFVARDSVTIQAQVQDYHPPGPTIDCYRHPEMKARQPGCM